MERSIVIDAPRERVWKALTTAETFGTWFGADLQGETFAVGKRTRGRIRMAGLEHVWFDVLVERMEAPSLFVWRWHPYAIDPETDYSTETPTQVSIRLDDAPGNATRVQVTESGFDALPRHRWSDAFRANNNGWDFQLDNLTRHVATQNRTPA
ncbi:MAG: SRPBCC family protein [Pseudomonadota bacterium]